MASYHPHPSREQGPLEWGLGETQHSWPPTFSGPHHQSMLDSAGAHKAPLCVVSWNLGSWKSLGWHCPRSLQGEVPLLMRLEPGKTGLRGKISCHQKAPVLWKSSITFDDSSRSTMWFALFIVFRDKRSFCSALC